MKVAKNAQISVQDRTVRKVPAKPVYPKENRFRKFSRPTQVNRLVGD